VAVYVLKLRGGDKIPTFLWPVGVRPAAILKTHDDGEKCGGAAERSISSDENPKRVRIFFRFSSSTERVWSSLWAKEKMFIEITTGGLSINKIVD